MENVEKGERERKRIASFASYVTGTIGRRGTVYIVPTSDRGIGKGRGLTMIGFGRQKTKETQLYSLLMGS